MASNSKPLLAIDNLSVSFRVEPLPDGSTEVEAVRNVSFDLDKGEILAIVGESGSGKSVTALSIVRLLPYPQAFHPNGSVYFEDENLLEMKDSALRSVRGHRISMIFQEPMTSLNPLHTIEKQLMEAITLHQVVTPQEAKERVRELLTLVGLEAMLTRMHAYPHELSGGQRQRVMIAMALANNPDILIADEPTTALDVTIQAQILNLLVDLQKKLGMAVILISHDLTIVQHMANRVAVMHKGQLVETGTVKDIFSNPQHDYTKHLLASAPTGGPVPVQKEGKDMITTSNLKVHFPVKKGFFGGTKDVIKAVNDVSLTIKEGFTLGVVGESGSGKSTLGFALLRLVSSSGDIFFDEQDIQSVSSKDLKFLRKDMQFVFQDPFSSLNPRMTVGQIISEGVRVHQPDRSKEEYDAAINQALQDVSLDPSVKNRYPHEFSGGQRQRIGIARALVLKPKFIVLDEPTSALDLSTQAEILHILKDLQQKHRLTYLFISHDLRVIRAISHDIIVMKNGKIIEQGTRGTIFDTPKTEYTQQLISAAFEVK